MMNSENEMFHFSYKQGKLLRELSAIGYLEKKDTDTSFYIHNSFQCLQ